MVVKLTTRAGIDRILMDHPLFPGSEDIPENFRPVKPEYLRGREGGDLKREEEGIYFESVQFKRREIHRAAEEGRYSKVFRANEEARDLLNAWCEKNIGLVYSMAFKRGVNFDSDEFSNGLFALNNATRRFNVFRGFKFSTYACNSINRGFIPRRIAPARKREVYVEDPMGFEKLIRVPVNDDSDLQNRLIAFFINSGKVLNKREESVLYDRVFNGLTLREIGIKLELSKERIRQIQKRAIGKIRDVALPKYNEICGAA